MIYGYHIQSYSCIRDVSDSVHLLQGGVCWTIPVDRLCATSTWEVKWSLRSYISNMGYIVWTRVNCVLGGSLRGPWFLSFWDWCCSSPSRSEVRLVVLGNMCLCLRIHSKLVLYWSYFGWQGERSGMLIPVRMKINRMTFIPGEQSYSIWPKQW